MQVLDFLEHDATRAITIRYVCGLRKVLLHNLDRATAQDLERLRNLSELYSKIGHEARIQAFEESKQRNATQQTEPEPEPLIAEKLTQTQAGAYINLYLLELMNDDVIAFMVQDAYDFVEKKHLGQYVWSETDTIIRGGCMAWKQVVSNVLQNLKVAGKLAYSPSRREWVLL